ncbi:hypothetical protein EVAR_22258_1 [Eumeta japonica]|uniref:Uncharacterized protein n=1 Tax=Eumeta variegata TaxID=151549 RepID=A0A4C1UB96_EUMVA|nr:hypothetical protein EVAR_22258_1 [Eumeta japonica]
MTVASDDARWDIPGHSNVFRFHLAALSDFVRTAVAQKAALRPVSENPNAPFPPSITPVSPSPAQCTIHPAPFPFHQPTVSSIRYSILTHEDWVTLLGLRVSMGNGEHILFDGSHTRLLKAKFVVDSFHSPTNCTADNSIIDAVPSSMRSDRDRVTVNILWTRTSRKYPSDVIPVYPQPTVACDLDLTYTR